MDPALADDRPQTTAQWAVRWHGLVVCALLFGSVPLFHFVWHVLLGHEAPFVRTRSQPAGPPPVTRAAVLDGSWMVAQERYLREAAPLTWWLRSNWNELRYVAGMPLSRQVHFGAGDWFFLAESVRPERAAFERARPARRQFLADVRDLVRAAGAELFVNVLPDKATLYPEHCWPGGVLPEAKAGAYEAILADVAAVGIPTIDVLAAMRAAKVADPASELYYRRDTHWRPAGALVAGQVVAAAIEARFGDRLGARSQAVIASEGSRLLLGDLAALAGFRTFEIEDDDMSRGLAAGERQSRTAPMSFLTDRLAELRKYYSVQLVTPAGPVPMTGKDPAAEVLVLGASFSEENGAAALALALGRQVRTYIVRGAAGMGALRAALPELRAGTKAKVVVWDLVERGFFESLWLTPKL
jgi:hypothetical protein